MFTGNAPRPLEGIKVVELATFIAVPGCAKFLADMGADVVKVEAIAGDFVRWSGANEGRPEDPLENTTFDLENGNKRSIAINVKDPRGRAILDRLLDKADIFLTNWRPGALERQGLDYETLKQKYPALVYGTLTGYGDEGPDKDLPGYDTTAFFVRGGQLGTLYEATGQPMNLINGLGDHQAAYMLAAGILAALYRAKQTGQGEKVSTNLLHASIFTQGIMILAAQYPDVGLKYPMKRCDIPNPLTGCYKTSDERWVWVSMPQHDHFYPTFMTAIGREDLKDDPCYGHLIGMIEAGRSRELYDIICEQVAQKPLKEWVDIFTKADIPNAPALLWEEVLEDEQAWANKVFFKSKHDNGRDVIEIRTPVNFEETPAPGETPSPLLGQQTFEVVKELGFSDDEMKEMLDDKVIREWHVGENPFKY